MTPLTKGNVDNSSSASPQGAKVPERRQADVADLKVYRRRLVPARECRFLPLDDTFHKRCRADDGPRSEHGLLLLRLLGRVPFHALPKLLPMNPLHGLPGCARVIDEPIASMGSDPIAPSPLTFAICWQSQHSTANSPPRITSHPLNHPTQRPRLIVPANTSISIIPPTTPHTPNSLFPAAANTHRQFLHPLSPINQLMQHQLASR